MDQPSDGCRQRFIDAGEQQIEKEVNVGARGDRRHYCEDTGAAGAQDLHRRAAVGESVVVAELTGEVVTPGPDRSGRGRACSAGRHHGAEQQGNHQAAEPPAAS